MEPIEICLLLHTSTTTFTEWLPFNLELFSIWSFNWLKKDVGGIIYRCVIIFCTNLHKTCSPTILSYNQNSYSCVWTSDRFCPWWFSDVCELKQNRENTKHSKWIIRPQRKYWWICQTTVYLNFWEHCITEGESNSS